MGSAGSTPRTMTMKNEEPHIIEITTDVVNRIKHGYPVPDVSQPQQSSAQTQTPNRQEFINPNPPEEERETFALGVGKTGHPILETVSAIQVRQQKDEELRANDFLWRTKLKELEGRYANSAFASEQEFSSQLESLRRFVPKRREAVCQDISPKVSACYAANPKQVLKCSDLVREFASCVEEKLGKTLLE